MLQIAFVADPLRKNGAIKSRVIQRVTVPFEEMVAHMSKGAVVSETDMKAVISQFSESLVHFLAKGNQVQTPMGTFTVSLRRRSTLATERKLSTDYLSLRLRPTPRILEELRNNIQVSVVDTPPMMVPLVYTVTNIDRKGITNAGNPGEIFHITGARLSFKEEDANQGVFFISADGKSVLRAYVYSRMGSSFIDCKIPNIAPGSYTMEVRTQTGKTLRKGFYQTLIIIG